jgi:hypothetical protein
MNAIEQLIDDHVNGEPIVNNEVVEKVLEKESTNEPDSKPSESTTVTNEPNDSVFNPDIHSTDGNGNPVRKKNGQYARKRGRRAGFKGNASTEVKANPSTEVKTGAVVDLAKCESLATVATVSLTGALSAILGKDWEADHKESVLMRDALRDYMIATGYTEPPPEVMLIIAFGGYALPRVLKQFGKKNNGREGITNDHSVSGGSSVSSNFSGGNGSD